jgi:hypothetical protein
LIFLSWWQVSVNTPGPTHSLCSNYHCTSVTRPVPSASFLVTLLCPSPSPSTLWDRGRCGTGGTGVPWLSLCCFKLLSVSSLREWGNLSPLLPEPILHRVETGSSWAMGSNAGAAHSPYS